jgi:hypothetical protein
MNTSPSLSAVWNFVIMVHSILSQLDYTVYTRSNTGIVGSNPTQGIDVCLLLFCVYVVLWPCEGLIPRPRSPADCLSLRN